jgi:LysR family transcriptional regulator, glycine cleavage system transcriptional activator
MPRGCARRWTCWGRARSRRWGRRRSSGLKLAILPTFGTRWLMPRIPGFVRRHPEITLQFATRIGWFDLRAEGSMRRSIRARGLAGRAADAADAGTGGAGGRAVAGPVGADWTRLPLLALSSRPQAWASWRAARGLAGPTPAPVMRFEQFATLAQAAAGGLGLALMPAS